jgi:hypothetical protein
MPEFSDSSNPYLCLRIDRSDTTVGERATQNKKFLAHNQDHMQGER